jgi:predicted amidohydrolase
MKVRIGAAQMSIIPLNIEKNLEKAKLFTKRAGENECDIICFPEIFLTGSLRKENLKYAQEISGEFTEKFCKLAEEHGLYIVMGSIIEREGKDYYNTSVLIDDSGNILGRYRKIRLWHPEKLHINRGSETPVFKTKFGKVGITICWDLAFPEITKEMALKGARMIFCPSFWLFEDKYGALKSKKLMEKVPDLDTESIFIDACASARAIENEVTHTFVNGCGHYTTLRLIGRTQINVPFYGRVALAEANEEKLLIKDVDLNLTTLAEKVYKIKRDSFGFTLNVGKVSPHQPLK